MTLTSDDITDGEPLTEAHVYNGFGCEGGNLSPALSWSGAPEGTESFAVTVYDPDAPTGSGWWHWTLFNIPAETTSLPTGVGVEAPLPEGAVQGRTDFGGNAFGGACPPEGHGPHRYIFTVYALPDESLPVDESASGAMVGYFLQGGALDSASITATYER
ncbi:YbhB/YbcL family Raf kinase inhibitor-like protein [uncultured Rhodospira sp.]|uniref:YbhB/YbcL family Raf kinase inhibitor-like protein n=1 Tax=uncultured Rhodospira sp. TaxID=1936189 RepID=UPI0026324FFB|nr:YbhB/YbcL family Raf kinase inhibitor-like protein [uncultured Rhodospira sp.]